MKQKTALGSRASVSLATSRGGRQRVLAPRGTFRTIVNKPLESTDIEKTRALARSLGRPLHEMKSPSGETIIPLSWWIRAEQALRNGTLHLEEKARALLAEIESTLFGGGVKHPLSIDRNIVFDAGQGLVLDVLFGTTAKPSNWYMGLTSGTPVFAETDTLASHTAEPTGWDEFTNYTETLRQTITFPATSTGQSIDNTGNKCVFTADTGTGQTIGGLIVADNSTKGGTTGILYNGVAFTGGDKTGIDAGDTLSADVTLTAADDGV